MNEPRARIIAVFGGSRPLPGSAEYQEAYTMGRLLAQEGFVVMNGGYGGTMEASARGAREHGGRTIGVLSGEFGDLAPNLYLDETLQNADMFARIREMQLRADAFLVLKGSMGTLAELALVWNQSKVNLKHRKPIILVGMAWQNVLRAWSENLAVTDEEMELLQAVHDPREAVERLKQVLRDGHAPSPRAPSPVPDA
jgi:uncharacterized protein (TIGR00730 family)